MTRRAGILRDLMAQQIWKSSCSPGHRVIGTDADGLGRIEGEVPQVTPGAAAKFLAFAGVFG